MTLSSLTKLPRYPSLKILWSNLTTLSFSFSYIQSVEIVLGVKGLSIIGIENLAAHEFGHALGLGHSNKKGDLMYPSFDMVEEKKAVVSPSTLNLYALTVSHGWLSDTTFYEYYGSLAITLPAYILYKKAP